jgi:hypothetical protein
MIIKPSTEIRMSEVKNATKVIIGGKPCILFEKHDGEVTYFPYETEEKRDRVFQIYEDKINGK